MSSRSSVTDKSLGHVVFRPSPAFRDSPIDILIWNLDITGLAMDAAKMVS